MAFEIKHGDCLEVMRGMADNSVDAIVTDPPYGLSFMGKKWDYDVPSVEVWEECLRVLKPGGHLLAFAGTRTQHRMAVRIEDAGFEIRDMIAWVYGSGFPKSLDVSKAMDKAAGRTARDVVALKGELRRVFEDSGMTILDLNKRCGFEASGYLRTSSTWASVLPSQDKWWKMREVIGCDDRLSFAFKETEREVIGFQKRGNAVSTSFMSGGNNITAPATPDAERWQGWGTALKPSMEPITVARKPLVGTVAANVLEHGTGALNIDGCRVAGFAPGEYEKLRARADTPRQDFTGGRLHSGAEYTPKVIESGMSNLGRWPANLIHDGSEEVLAGFPDTGKSTGGQSSIARGFGEFGGGSRTIEKRDPGYGDTGSAARFFYCAKASRKDRNEGLTSDDAPAVANGATMREREDADWSKRNGNHHPTVKPTDLMAYLCRLVTPPGGLVLDPFTGSGSTGKAAVLEGFEFIGIEREAEYVAIAEARIAAQ